MAIPTDRDYVIMSTRKASETTAVTVENRRLSPSDLTKIGHIAGGSHHGIIVLQNTIADSILAHPVDHSVEFHLFLVSKISGKRVRDNCRLHFQFTKSAAKCQHPRLVSQFLKCIAPPDRLPCDYVHLITNVIKVVQQDQGQQLVSIRLEMTEGKPEEPAVDHNDNVVKSPPYHVMKLQPVRSIVGGWKSMFSKGGLLRVMVVLIRLYMVF